MPLPRDQLIADWHAALAAAERQPLGASAPFWLARMRVRLYRFLLSLYGDGQWNTDSPVSAPQEPNPLTIDAPEVFPFHGKPAKGEGKIRAVLKSVSGAQGPPPAAGPLIAGIGSEGWAVAAAESSNLDPARTALLLDRHGIVARAVRRGNDVTVEVAAQQLKKALELVDAHRSRLRVRRREWPVLPVWILWGFLFAPLVGIVTVMVVRIVFGVGVANATLGWDFAGGCTASIVAGAVMQMLSWRPHVAHAVVHQPFILPPVLGLWLSFAPLCAIVAVFSAVNTYPNAGDRGNVPQLVLHGIAVFGLLSLLVLYRPVAKLVNRLALACKARLRRRTPATTS
jgi:hypothetical protein